MKSIRVRIKAKQFDGSTPESMGFKLGKTYNLIPFRVNCGEVFYRRRKGAGVWLASRFYTINK